MRKVRKHKSSKSTNQLLVKLGAYFVPTAKGPDEVLGDLLEDVQRQRVYDDGKTFVDLVPKMRMKSIRTEYQLERQDPKFDLREFINRHFYAVDNIQQPFISDPSKTTAEHITSLWPVLKRTNQKDHGSLLALPHSYIVPGGRFEEQYYWDSYFTMLGLAAEERWSEVEGMFRNFTHLIRRLGFVPTANRSYYLSRSQPPFLSHMLELLEGKYGQSMLVKHLPYLVAEYRFWMKGADRVLRSKDRAYRRVVKMPDGSLLNRYFDNHSTPRPEMLLEDVTAANGREGYEARDVYVHLRAAAESGWDFSSRWFGDGGLSTTHTTDIIPVDLNCLLYHLELTIARGYKKMKNQLAAKRYQQRADMRRQAINTYCWSSRLGAYVDFDMRSTNQSTSLTLATAFPLFVGIADQSQAEAVAKRLKDDFLKPGGLVTTLVETGEQWDSPNGWAPLQWVAIEGLRRYGFDELADEIGRRWLETNDLVYKQHGKMIEKYNVVQPGELAGGGEYPLQDGFGWSNGVYQALKKYKQ